MSLPAGTPESAKDYIEDDFQDMLDMDDGHIEDEGDEGSEESLPSAPEPANISEEQPSASPPNIPQPKSPPPPSSETKVIFLLICLCN